MEVNKDKITALIGEIEKSVNVLKELKQIKKEDLLEDLKALGSVKYYFIIAIEACIDICNHIASKQRWGIPNSYATCFNLLKDCNVLDDAFARKMVNMAKFRNLLVHFYRKVDDEKVYEFLQTELQSFQTYIDLISKRYL
jgi:uncharacterized protein YutE (UPF0331/DUF86 family)